MKRIFIFAALAATILTACQQELNIDENKPDTPVVFTATTESAATKTALSQNGENYDVLWQDGDQITVVDAAANVGVYQTASTTTQGSFSYVSGTAAATPDYKAWYPASLYGEGTPTLPATQEYTAGNIKNSPMYAESSTESLSFKNLCGIIRLNVSTTQSDKKVRRIILSADQGMSGAITNAATLASDSYIAAVSGMKGVTLDCGESGVAITTTPTAFHIAVPEGTYTTLKITVTTTDGLFQTRTLKSDKSIVVDRSSIADVTIPFNDLQAITATAANISTAVAEFNASPASDVVLMITEDISASITITRADGVIDFNGHTVSSYMFLQNNEAGKAVTLKNGTLSADLDGKAEWNDWYDGTVVLENMTITGDIFTDGHAYEFISGNYSGNIQNYVADGKPGTVVIRDGFFRGSYETCGDHGNKNNCNKGSYTLYGGKYAISPTNANQVCASGYSVKVNTGSDSSTYPYIVSED